MREKRHRAPHSICAHGAQELQSVPEEEDFCGPRGAHCPVREREGDSLGQASPLQGMQRPQHTSPHPSALPSRLLTRGGAALQGLLSIKDGRPARGPSRSLETAASNNWVGGRRWQRSSLFVSTVMGAPAPELPGEPRKGGFFAKDGNSIAPLLKPASLAPSKAFMPRTRARRESALTSPS